MKYINLFLFIALIFSLLILTISCKNNAVLIKKIKQVCSEGMCDIPEGDFIMGCNEKPNTLCLLGEKPAHKVYLNAFKIDQYEVTVAQFRKCVNAAKCSSSNYKTSDDYRFNNYGNSERDNHPMNAVNWYGAKEYCSYVGKRLPTEAEWEKAARGTDNRIYSWGNKKANCSYAVMNEKGDYKSENNGCTKGATSKVGSKPSGKSPYGLYDMAGNLWEWVADYYDAGYYKSSPSKNPKRATKNASHVLRGGGWTNTSIDLRSYNRYYAKSNSFNLTFGFRCAKSVQK